MLGARALSVGVARRALRTSFSERGATARADRGLQIEAAAGFPTRGRDRTLSARTTQQRFAVTEFP